MSIGLFEKIMDRIFVVLWVGIALLAVWIFVFLIPQAIQRDNRAQEATEPGCTYILAIHETLTPFTFMIATVKSNLKE